VPPPKFGLAKTEKVMEMTGGRCWYCGDPAGVIDRVLATTHGGSDNYGNLVPACAPCAARKGDCKIEEFRARLALRNGWRFTAAQTAYLASLNMTLPPAPAVTFFFEREGLRSRPAPVPG